MKAWVRRNWILLVASFLLVGCSLLPESVRVEACLDHPRYGTVCAVLIGKDLYLKYDLAFLPTAEKTELVEWAKDQLGIK